MSIFKPTRNADFLRSRNLFFVVILVLHLIWSIVAALDVSSRDTRQTSSHVAVAAYNLAIQVISFGTVSFLYLIDSKDVEKNKWISHIFFEIILLSILSVLQIAGALAYSALSPRFACGTTVGSACSTAIRAILVGSWTISLLYLIFMLWFTTSVVIAARRDSTVWRSRARSFDWEAEGHPSLIIPSSPINILGAEKSGTDSLPKPRKTWVLPLVRQGPRPRLESTPHLPIQNLPPPTPFYPAPPVPPIPEHVAVNRQSIPEDISLTDTRDDDLRPVSMPQSVVHKQRNKIMSIKPLRLQRTRGSVDKSEIGLPKAITIGHETLTDSKIMSLTAVESQFQHWWDPQSSFAAPRRSSERRSGERRSSERPSFLGAPTISSRSRYSTTTTVPPTPPPKDNWRLPQSATTANTPMHEYPDRRLMSSPPPRGYI